MVLASRPTTVADWVKNKEWIVPLGFDESLLAECPKMWAQLIKDRQMVSAIFEDRANPRQPKLLGMGASVFVTDEFADELRSFLLPYMGATVARRWLQGKSPILPVSAIKEACAGEGLNVCILHQFHAIRPDEQLPLAARDEIAMVFLGLHRGYRFKQFFQEEIRNDIIEWLCNSGCHLRCDYNRVRQDHSQQSTSSAVMPQLVGVARDDFIVGSRASMMFLDVPSRLGFRNPQIELLERALQGETDEELADSLFISLSAVKKRWTAIYDQVEAIDPYLLDENPEVPEGKRGSEKRRHLLNYLREHGEELRWGLH